MSQRYVPTDQPDPDSPLLRITSPVSLDYIKLTVQTNHQRLHQRKYFNK